MALRWVLVVAVGALCLSQSWNSVQGRTLLKQEDEIEIHYDGYTVYRLLPQDTEQLKYLSELELNNTDGLDFWMRASKPGFYVDVNVPPPAKKAFEEKVEQFNITSQVLIPDLEQEIKNATAQKDEIKTRNQDDFFMDYQSFRNINDRLRRYTVTNADIARLLDIGQSFENRDMKVLRLTTRPDFEGKKSIWLDGGMHAREWISPATVMYIIDSLIDAYNRHDEDARKILETFDIFVLPVANPDGYEYSRDYQRMWRKTRSRTFSLIGCRGVDPNRNFGYKWGQAGVSTNLCNDVYAGPHAFSEPETRNIRDFIYPRRERLMGFLTFHSYSQLWLTPWGYTDELPANYKEMEKAAKIAVDALEKIHGSRYRVGSSTSLLYEASGGSDDWAHGAVGVPYAYTVELRDDGRYGFLLPPREIIPTGEETYAAVKALLLHIADKTNGVQDKTVV